MKVYTFAATALVFLQELRHTFAIEADACINQEDKAEGGEYECYGKGDHVGMVCGGDGTPDESYCEKSATGLMVCARKQGGGRCDPAYNNTPYTTKKHDDPPSEEM
eukprot:TRINITY_DN22189_c0_g1_i2.p3 TRINITY_DN22189_c0_g1~~TRINITY_DN22189_c0_g1_i2.p3  ORF type:complete len:106 (-),score=23.53 TRINITY_DN22189_c0_g1_i2:228-545(-)